MTARTPLDAERRMLNYTRAAAYLGISVRSLRDLANKAGEIRTTPIGHRVLFDKRDLDDYIERAKRSA